MFTWLHTIVAESLTTLRDVIGAVTGPDTGLTWALAIIVLSVITRLILLPLNVKQFHGQQKMQRVQPQLKEVAERFKKKKKDLESAPLSAEVRRERLKEMQVEQLAATRAVTQEHGFKFSTILVPIVFQGLIGYSIFQVIRVFRPGGEPRFGLSAEQVASGTDATFLGAPLSAALTTSSDVISKLGGDPSSARLGAFVLLVLATVFSVLMLKMGLSRTANVLGPTTPSTGPKKPPTTPEEIMAETMETVQNLMKTRGPLILGGMLTIVYLFMPIGLLLSILVVVVWAYVYQRIMYRKHPAVGITSPQVATEALSAEPVEKVVKAPVRPASTKGTGGSKSRNAKKKRR